jgi:hypothetical protein
MHGAMIKITNTCTLNSIHFPVQFEEPEDELMFVEICSLMWIKYLPTK